MGDAFLRLSAGLVSVACSGQPTAHSGVPFEVKPRTGVPVDGGAGGAAANALGTLDPAANARDAEVTAAGGAPALPRMPAASCARTADRLSLEVHPPPGVTPTVQSVTIEFSFDGRVTATSATDFLVDACAPGTGCVSSVYAVTMTGPGLVPSSVIPKDALVHVHFRATCPVGCVTNSLYVGSLSEWHGLQNPQRGLLDFYFSGDDGGFTLPEAPYTLTPVPLDCNTEEESGTCSDPAKTGLYALDFAMKESGEVTRVYMGTPQGLLSTLGPEVDFHNVRSFVTGACDDYWNFAHWVRPAVPLR